MIESYVFKRLCEDVEEVCIEVDVVVIVESELDKLMDFVNEE